jgi:hypothetical protein
MNIFVRAIMLPEYRGTRGCRAVALAAAIIRMASPPAHD